MEGDEPATASAINGTVRRQALDEHAQKKSARQWQRAWRDRHVVLLYSTAGAFQLGRDRCVDRQSRGTVSLQSLIFLSRRRRIGNGR